MPAVYIGGINLMDNSSDLTAMNFKVNVPKVESSVRRVETLPDDVGVAFLELNLSQIAKEVPLT